MNIVALFHNMLCGALAAAGFGVLFNVSFRGLPWCAAGGALALAMRTIAIGIGCNFEAGSFLAALAVGFVASLLPTSAGLSRGAFHVVGCIPMIPGGFAAKAILGLFAITVQQPAAAANENLLLALVSALRVIFTLGALGTGLAIPALLLRSRETNR